jgi:RHS repeat-associated protein
MTAHKQKRIVFLIIFFTSICSVKNSVADIVGPVRVCAGAEYSYNAGRVSGTRNHYWWQIEGGAITNSPGSYQVYVKWSGAGGKLILTVTTGEGDELVYSKTVQTYAGGSVTGQAAYCNPASGTLNLTGNSGAPARWEYSVNGYVWTAIANTTTVYSFSGITQPTQFRAVIDGGACGLIYSTPFTVNPTAAPAAPVTTSASRCGNGGVTLYANGSGAMYRWYNSSGTLLHEGTSRFFNTPILDKTTSYYVSTVIAQGCESARAMVTATVTQIPAAPPVAYAFNISAYCGYTDVTKAPAPSGLTYYWQTSPDDYSTGNTSPTTRVSTPGYVYLRTRDNTTGCWSATAVQWITVHQHPAAPADPVISAECGKVILTPAAPTAAVDYYWQTDASSTVETYPAFVHQWPPSTAYRITPDTITTAGTYYIRAKSAFMECWSAPTPIVVTAIGRQTCLEGQNTNYVVTNNIQTSGVQDDAFIGNLSLQDNVQSVTYMDGFGRAIQQVSSQGSPTQKDIVQIIAYDKMGRENKKYLPYTVAGVGRYKSDAMSAMQEFYSGSGPENDRASTSTPWAETVFEASALNEIKEQGMAGEAWQAGSGHTIRTNTRANTAVDAVKHWVYDFASGQCRIAGSYAAGELQVKEIINENDNRSLIYTDKQGRTILVKNEAGGEAAQTYNIYDDFSQLRMVIQPEGVKELSPSDGTTPDASFIDKWCFVYKYDKLGRITEKKIPGAEAVYYVYNKRDLPVLVQDGEQRKGNCWKFTKYDALGRPVLSGIYSHPAAVSQPQMQQAADQFSGQYESRTAVNYAAQHGYTIDQSFPALDLVKDQLLTAIFYDDYDFDRNPGTTDAAYVASGLSNEPEVCYETINRVTGTATNILGATKWLMTVLYYDKKGNAIQAQKENHLGGKDIVTSRYDFAGKLIESECKHQTATASIKTKELHYYDHMGRTVSRWHQINNGAWVKLAAYRHNELGQVVEKKLHSSDEVNYLQKVDYRYNIRGWTTRINDASLSDTTDLFGMELRYNEGPVSQPGAAYYNGNVAELMYTDKKDNQPKAYVFSYDKLDRLINSAFAAKSASGWNAQFGAFNEGGIEYDLNGNIKKLQRYALLNGQTERQSIDELAYSYTGNRLEKVTDIAMADMGFNNSVELPVEYTYDANGNLVKDMNKAIQAMNYNHLNLLTKVRKGNDSLQYTYDASGTLLSKVTYNTSTGSTVKKDYVNGFEYSGSQLTFFATPEGRVTLQGTNYNYEYNLKDHLGNVRVSFDRNPETGKARIIQRTAYYPFGGEQPGGSYVSGQPNKYLYNGKEFQDDLGLNVYHYDARMYDPMLARWNGVDPLADKYYPLSPFAYVANNPLKYIDPDGKRIIVSNDNNPCMPQEEYEALYITAAKYLIDNGAGEYLERLEKSQTLYVIKYATERMSGRYEDNTDMKNIFWSAYQEDAKIIYWDPFLGFETDLGYVLSSAEVLNHEFGHAAQQDEFPEQFKKDSNTPDRKYDDKEERRNITGPEQETARKLGKLPNGEVTRKNHDGYNVYTEGPTSSKKDIDKAVKQGQRCRQIKNKLAEDREEAKRKRQEMQEWIENGKYDSVPVAPSL